MTTAAIDSDVAAAFNLIARRTFTEFTSIDWTVWSGCITKTPMISYGETDNDAIIIIDGDRIVLYSKELNEEYHIIGELVLT